MKKLLVIILVALITTNIQAQKFKYVLDGIKVIDDQILTKAVIRSDNDSLYIVNFWASWCGNCLMEMPYFEEMRTKYDIDGLDVRLISLDEERTANKAARFLISQSIDTQAYLLSPGRLEHAIDGQTVKVIDLGDKTFGTDLPATIMYKRGQRVFMKIGRISKQELETAILKNIGL